MSAVNQDWIRPYGIIINGELERGLEIAVVYGVVREIRASSHEPEPFIISPGFVNAHSHLEYRGMLDQIPHPEYYEWIYELSRLKPLESPEFVRKQCLIAAEENRKTGVAWIGEHSDRPGSAEAMVRHGLGGWIFQEVITSGSADVGATMLGVVAKMELAREILTSSPDTRASDNQPPPVHTSPTPPSGRVTRLGLSLSPHAYFTVSHETLRMLGNQDAPISIHVSETEHETNFTKYGQGPLADRRRQFGVPFDVYGLSVVEVLNDLGVLRPGTQCVHCCDVDENDIALMAKGGVTIAHCPRSNVRLQCPIAPVREFLDAGITVGLGMDSPASGGAIDMFAEMRSALFVSVERGKPLTGEEVWRMATSEGYRSFGKPESAAWDIYQGSTTPLIFVETIGEAKSMEDVIASAQIWKAGKMRVNIVHLLHKGRGTNDAKWNPSHCVTVPE